MVECAKFYDDLAGRLCGFPELGAEDEKTVILRESDECMKEVLGHPHRKPTHSPPCSGMLHCGAGIYFFLNFAERND